MQIQWHFVELFLLIFPHRMKAAFFSFLSPEVIFLIMIKTSIFAAPLQSHRHIFLLWFEGRDSIVLCDSHLLTSILQLLLFRPGTWGFLLLLLLLFKRSFLLASFITNKT